MEFANGTRFGMFAVAHILWSVVCSPFVLRLLSGRIKTACITAAVMMLAYFLLGWLVAHFSHWPVPSKNQSLWSISLPAGIAWLWAGSTALCLYSGGDNLTGIAAILGLPAFLVASPSLLFVMAFMGWVGASFYQNGIITNEAAVMAVAIFLAGLLPSLLFSAGSLWGSKRQKKEPGAA